MATYAEGNFTAGGYKFGAKLREGWCPKSVYVDIKAQMGGPYSNVESFAKREIGNRSTEELTPKIRAVAHVAAVNAHWHYGDAVKNCPDFDENFVNGLEPILIEGINSFNGIKPAGKEETLMQKVISALRGK